MTLFFTEMWERFSFYGMRALLVIYLTQHFLFSDDKAQGPIRPRTRRLFILIPVIGGVIADRFLGSRKAVTIGAVLLVLGHFGMAFEGRGSVQEITIASQTYDIVAEGRGEARALFIEHEGQQYPVAFTAEGMTVDPASGLPNFTATADYELSTRPDVLNLGGVSIPYEQILYLSLAFIIVGVGFLKANNSPRRSARSIARTIRAAMAASPSFTWASISGRSWPPFSADGWGQTYGWAYGLARRASA